MDFQSIIKDIEDWGPLQVRCFDNLIYTLYGGDLENQVFDAKLFPQQRGFTKLALNSIKEILEEV